MPGPQPDQTVKAVDRGEKEGIFIPIAHSQCVEAGVDPDDPVEVSRYVFDSDRATIRLRLRNVDED